MLLMHLTPAQAIVAVDTVADEFRVAGDQTAFYLDTVAFRVVGSTGNDGNYTCNGNAIHDVGPNQTVIAVNEDITNAVADGDIEVAIITSVTSMTGPGLSLDVEDVTAHDSLNAWEEVVATIIRSGEVSFDVNFDPDNPLHNQALGTLESLTDRDLRDYELVFPTTPPDSIEFAGFLVGFEPSAPHEGKLAAAVRIKPTTTVTV